MSRQTEVLQMQLVSSKGEIERLNGILESLRTETVSLRTQVEKVLREVLLLLRATVTRI